MNVQVIMVAADDINIVIVGTSYMSDLEKRPLLGPPAFPRTQVIMHTKEVLPDAFVTPTPHLSFRQPQNVPRPHPNPRG